MSLHVPEAQRIRDGSLDERYGNSGAFLITSTEPGWLLLLIADAGVAPEAQGWEHVSVSARGISNINRTRVPSWREMCHVKELCWDAEDVVMQLHPRRSVYVNQHPHVLHLWRHRTIAIPEPPPELVGVLT